MWATARRSQWLAGTRIRVSAASSPPLPCYFGAFRAPRRVRLLAAQRLTWLTDVFIDFATCFFRLAAVERRANLSHDAPCFDANAGDANSSIPRTISPVSSFS